MSICTAATRKGLSFFMSFSKCSARISTAGGPGAQGFGLIFGAKVVKTLSWPTGRQTGITDTAMAQRKRNYKFKWRSKKAHHGRKPARGKLKAWGKKS